MPNETKAPTNQKLESYSFRGQRADEEALLVVRQHVWLLMPVVLVWLVVIAVISLVVWHFGASRTTSFAIVFGLVLGGLYSLYQWFIWNNGIYIVTTQRVIRIEQNSLFNRQISEAEIGRIQEISTEIKGPIHTMLNFGTVKIQTASTSGQIDLQDVVDPYDIQQQIVQVQRQIAAHAHPQATELSGP